MRVAFYLPSFQNRSDKPQIIIIKLGEGCYRNSMLEEASTKAWMISDKYLQEKIK